MSPLETPQTLSSASNTGRHVQRRGAGALGYAIIRALRTAAREDGNGGRVGWRALWEVTAAAGAEYCSWEETDRAPYRANILRALRRLVVQGEVDALLIDHHRAQPWRKGEGDHGDRGFRPVPIYRINTASNGGA